MGPRVTHNVIVWVRLILWMATRNPKHQLKTMGLFSLFHYTSSWLVVWNIFYFSISYMGIIIPTDFHSIIFQRGRAQPPTIHTYIYIINGYKWGISNCYLWWWFIPLFIGFQASFWWCRIAGPSTVWRHRHVNTITSWQWLTACYWTWPFSYYSSLIYLWNMMIFQFAMRVYQRVTRHSAVDKDLEPNQPPRWLGHGSTWSTSPYKYV